MLKLLESDNAKSIIVSAIETIRTYYSSITVPLVTVGSPNLITRAPKTVISGIKVAESQLEPNIEDLSTAIV
jgi:hypothetical protein